MPAPRPRLLLDHVYEHETRWRDRVYLTQPLPGGPARHWHWLNIKFKFYYTVTHYFWKNIKNNRKNNVASGTGGH